MSLFIVATFLVRAGVCPEFFTHEDFLNLGKENSPFMLTSESGYSDIEQYFNQNQHPLTIDHMETHTNMHHHSALSCAYKNGSKYFYVIYKKHK